MSILKDFREFVGRGSVIDFAIGVIVGSAITAILKSFVDEMIVPLTGLVSKVDFTNHYLVLRGVVTDGLPLAEARKLPGVVALGYGQFLTVSINTMVLAFAVFLVARAAARLRLRMDAATPPPPPTPEVALLTEIRDLLRK